MTRDNIIKLVRKAYENQDLPEFMCLELAKIDHTIEITKSYEETVKFYDKLIKNQ